jgi:hypothetical protein
MERHSASYRHSDEAPARDNEKDETVSNPSCQIFSGENRSAVAFGLRATVLPEILIDRNLLKRVDLNQKSRVID